MCIFSKELLDSKNNNGPNKKKKPFNFAEFFREKNQSKQKEKAVERADKVKLELLMSYGITPLTFDLVRALKFSGATLGIGTTAAVGVPVGATAAGFTSSGIAAGSIAAGVQSSIGSVAAGSTFATLQSIGATGGFAILGPISLVAGGVGLTIAGATFIGIGIDKHLKEIKEFAKNTKLILPHI